MYGPYGAGGLSADGHILYWLVRPDAIAGRAMDGTRSSACQGSPYRRCVFSANRLAARTIQGPGFGTLLAVFINALSKPTAWMKATV